MRVSNPLANSYTKNQADNQFLTVDTSGSESGTPNPIDADTLNGKPASDYVLKNELYPVGSIYISMNSTDPSNYFGGVWQRIKKAFLFAADDESYIAGGTGGEETHALTEQEGPTHTHAGTEHQAGKFMTVSSSANEFRNVSRVNVQGAESGTGAASWQWASMRWTDTVENSGEGQPHNNMPPYLVVYIWQRMS